MEKIEYTLRKLVASEGHKLTQSADVDLEARLFATQLYLAANDSEENYREITDAEAEALKAEAEALAAERRAKAEIEEKRARLERELRELDEAAADEGRGTSDESGTTEA